ncbi:AfsR/SARP family transcriptional regulator [Umezawaea tangerina]|uniref:DNA-binding SARP family transcriptional activator n=1 Tax=Umezawaea tangerina TaxID=84725 RepID=A0A2T0TFU8_9PSEU|nr:BTAD domain-containing putative transcriptional regulator [Umezawaea tangerina]PRY44534.1 DNA-binding SARP family transcriptional activator [Umezawaea tangerina]
MELRLLGDVGVWRDGRAVDAGPARQRCVLAALLVDAGRVVSTDVLVDRVWGGRPPQRSRETLGSYASRLRRVLADSGATVRRQAGGYVLRVPPDAVDLHRFRDLCARARAADDQRAAGLLTEALALWRGEALTGVGGEWAEIERDRLRHERWGAEHDLTDVLLRLGHGEDLVADLSARVAHRPLDERVAGQYLLALHRAGRTADALAHYREVRRRLVDELGTDPGAALQDLHHRILAADPELGTATTTSAPSVVPRQLPAAPGPFVGRRAELDRLDTALRDAGSPAGSVAVSAIAGVGGVGKTWLALHWAHRNVDRFPDGQLFVDLHGFGPDGEPMDPAVAVRGFLDALGVKPDRVPADPHARVALFRSLVAGRRMLVVLDNAVDSAHVAPLLPGTPTCVAVVTSRARQTGLVTGHGAQHVPLDVLTDTEARALLVGRLGACRVEAEPAAVAELVGLCRGFPLVLAVIAGRAQTRSGAPLAALADELRELGVEALDDRDPAASLPAVLSWSLRDLSAEQRAVFGLLGAAPGPDIGLPAAVALTGLSPARTRRALRALEEASLLDRTDDDRSAMHDLVRGCAAGTAPDDRQHEAVRRVVDFYLHTAHAADHLLEPHRQPVRLEEAPGVVPHPLTDVPAALAWLEREHPNLLAAQHTAVANGWHATAWNLAWSLNTFHLLRGHLHSALTAWRAALAAAEHLPDATTRTRARRFLGYVCSLLGRHDDATAHLDRALALAREHRDLAEQAHTHRQHALVGELRDDLRGALEHAGHALDLYRALDLPVWEASALNMVGWFTAHLGDHDTARAHCLAALDLHRRHDDPGGEAHTQDSLGWIDHRTGRHREAIGHYRRALALFHHQGNTYEAADTLDRLGHLHTALDQDDRAREAWQEALGLYRDQGRDRQVDRVLRQLGSRGLRGADRSA